MISVEATGNRMLVWDIDKGFQPNAPPGTHYIYEVRVEWYLNAVGACPGEDTDLYRNNGRIAWNISSYDCSDGWDPVKNAYAFEAYYVYYDWVPHGTYYYKASLEGFFTDELSITL